MKNLLATVVLLILLATASPALSQSSCKVGVQAPPVGFWTWAPKGEIKVYVIESDFGRSELPFLLTALKTWNAVSDFTGSKVKFEYKGPTASPLFCENCLTIRRGSIFDKSKRHLTELKAFSATQNRIITWAQIVIDPLLTSPKTLTNAVAHELGHSFGLLDCYSCKASNTVMIQFEDVNISNEMDGPTSCDVRQVETVYQALTTERLRTPRPKPVVVDEGEEPVEDDTPVVIRKP